MARLMTKAESTSFKRRLSIARKKGPRAVLKVCDDYFALEGEVVLPDNWHTFRVAREDAVYALRREEAGL